MGWPTGIEPAPLGSHPSALTIELQPQCPAQDSNLQPAAPQAAAHPLSFQGMSGEAGEWHDDDRVIGRNYVDRRRTIPRLTGVFSRVCLVREIAAN